MSKIKVTWPVPEFAPAEPGFYTPTQNFKDVGEHYAVMDSRNHSLTALVGRVGDGNDKESISYQHLYSAAPDMLRVLKSLIEWGVSDNTDFNDLAEGVIGDAETVIKKAEGQE